MSLLPVKEINSCWSELEKNVAGNTPDNGERLLSAPFNTDLFLPYGHVGRIVTLLPRTFEAGVRFPAQPQVGMLVVACCWFAVYRTEP